MKIIKFSVNIDKFTGLFDKFLKTIRITTYCNKKGLSLKSECRALKDSGKKSFSSPPHLPATARICARDRERLSGAARPPYSPLAEAGTFDSPIYETPRLGYNRPIQSGSIRITTWRKTWTTLRQKALDYLDAQTGEAREIAQEIWNFAEIALEEFKSAELLEDVLEQNGFEVQRGVGDLPTAFIARWGDSGPAIGILGEYDALPHCGDSHEKQGHGCGHNLFGTAGAYAAIAAARALRESGAKGRVVCFGCPAEETLEGKVYMARDGAFDGIDAAVTWHPGEKSFTRGGSTNAMDSIVFRVLWRNRPLGPRPVERQKRARWRGNHELWRQHDARARHRARQDSLRHHGRWGGP